MPLGSLGRRAVVESKGLEIRVAFEPIRGMSVFSVSESNWESNLATV